MKQYSFSFDYNGDTKQVKKHWQFCIGSGHAALAHRADYLEQLKLVHDELGIERVRFHGVFNDDMHVLENLRNHLPIKFLNKTKVCNFYQVGKIYDNILSVGMKPFVELSFMPSSIASGKKTVFYYKGNITLPKKMEEWKEFIRSFVKFLINRYGIDEIRTWYFEVWNEPDLSCFFHGDWDEYVEFYVATSQAIKSIDDKIIVGGPSTTHSSHLEEFISFCKQNKVPLDFLSTHQYPTDALGHNVNKEIRKKLKSLKTTNTTDSMSGILQPIFDDCSHLFDAAKGYMLEQASGARKQVGSLPLFYTEWSISSNCVASIHDTIQTSSFIAKTVLDQQGVTDGSSYWTFSDIFEELYPFSEPFHGGFGLLTVNGIKKPSFWALKLLSKLPDTRYNLPITHDDVEYAAFRSVNGDVYVLLYAQSFEDSAHTFPVTFSIENAPEFTVGSIERINKTSGNPLAYWEKMGRPNSLTEEEVSQLKAVSQPLDESIDIDMKNGLAYISLNICENETALLILKNS